MKSPAFGEKKHLCSNCLTSIQGAYCAHCGQKHHAVLRHFSQVVGEFFTDVLNFDSKLLGTLKPLLFQPGMLSEEYFANRRMRYVSPLKLYFFLSVITFFLVQQSVENNVSPSDLIHFNDDAPKNSKPNGVDINLINGKPWHAKTNPINLPIPDTFNTLINERVTRLDAVLKSKDAKRQLIHAGLSALPTALLLMLPFFALLLKLAYLLNKRLYMEHLIVALHNHSFLLMYILCIVVASQLGIWWGESMTWLQSVIDAINNLLWIVLPVYYFLSLKRVYQQGWRKTALKFCLLGFFYLFLLVFGLVMIFIIGALTL